MNKLEKKLMDIINGRWCGEDEKCWMKLNVFLEKKKKKN